MKYSYDFRDGHAFDSAGVDLGKIAGMYRDTTTGEPSFLRTASGCYLPFEGSTIHGHDLHSAATRSHINAAPPVADPARITPAEQAALLRHYELDGPIVTAGASGLGLPRQEPAADGPVNAPRAADVVDDAEAANATDTHAASESELTKGEDAGVAEVGKSEEHGPVVYSGNPGCPSEHGIPVAEGNPGIPSDHPVVVGDANPGPSLIA